MRKKVVVVGGGAAGLACAYDLNRSGRFDLELIDAAPRLGGKISSERVGELVLEAGPDSFITAKPEALAFARELGLEGELLCTAEDKKDVFVYTRGALRRYPEGLMMLAPAKILPFLCSDLVPFSAKLRMGLEFFIAPGAERKDESLGDFVRRRFGEEAVEVIAGPVLGGIYAGDPYRLSLASTFPQFAELERAHGSVLRGMRGRPRPKAGNGRWTMFVTLKGGLSRLTEAAAKSLPEHCARLSAGLKRLGRGGVSPYRLELEDGGSVLCDAVVLALPADKAAATLSGFDGALAAKLGEIPFSSTATASLIYPAAAAAGRLEGFGFVVDRREKTTVIAATYSSTKFPGKVPAGKALIRCFLGGAGREEPLELSDEDLLNAIQADLRKIAGIAAPPESARLYRWPRANPQYTVGHAERVAAIAAAAGAHPGLLLAGSSYRGVGIPDCIRSGREAAARLTAAADAPALPSGVV